MKYFFTLIFSGVISIASAQHEPLYSQYMFNGLVLNPAYAGSTDALTGILHFRKQWSGFPGAPTTQTLCMHTPLRNKLFNIGFILVHDQFGITDKIESTGIFAYRTKTRSGNISVGMQAGFVSIKNNWNKILTDEDETNDIFTPGVINTIVPKLGIGVYYHQKNFFAGISIPQSIISKNGGRNFFLTSGYNFFLGSLFVLKPSVLIKYIKNSPIQTDINATLSFKELFSIGTSFRKNDSFVFLLEYKMQQISLGYAYDYLLSNLRNQVSGSHEFMIKYQFKYKINVMNPRDFH